MRLRNPSWRASHACVLLAGLAIALQPLSSASAGDKSDIKIGNLAPYSGPASA